MAEPPRKAAPNPRADRLRKSLLRMAHTPFTPLRSRIRLNRAGLAFAGSTSINSSRGRGRTHLSSLCADKPLLLFVSSDYSRIMLGRNALCFMICVATTACSSRPVASDNKSHMQALKPEAPPIVSLCDLIKQSQIYAGQRVTTTVRILATKHVTGIWDPACKRSCADLHFPSDDQDNASTHALLKELGQHSMGDHPVIATLTGTWLGTQNYEHQFLPQPRIVFEVSEAKGITHSGKIERPY